MPYYQKNNITLYHGDLREILLEIAENTVDHVATDPPYGLSFMESQWDHEVPGPEYWKAITRVCKPGAMLLAFGGTRTWHRLACAIEDAGWDLRDTLMWLHGQGFPKAADVGKLIDKAAGAAREPMGPKVYAGGHIQNHGGDKQGYHKWNGVGVHRDTAPATDLAKLWTGFAAALKPAWEPVLLAMKPLDGTIAHNAETWGVAGLNIDACRIPCDYAAEYGEKWLSSGKGKAGPWHATEYEETRTVAERVSPLGRWPANLILDEEAAAQLDAQTGTLKSGKMKAGQQRKRTKGGGGYHGGFPETASATGTYGDTGGASRFFYCSKATKKDRGEGNDHPTVKPLALMNWLLTLASTPTGGVILDPFAGSGTTLLAAQRLGRACIGVELDEHNCEIIANRLESA
jgi:site-specific DNA-methyltransferase (adenine-specific)